MNESERICASEKESNFASVVSSQQPKKDPICGFVFSHKKQVQGSVQFYRSARSSNMNFHTMEIGDKDIKEMADPSNNDAKVDSDDWVVLNSADKADVYKDIDLKKTVSAARTASTVTTQTAQTVPETPPRYQMKHTIDYGDENVNMGKNNTKNWSSDTDSNSHGLSDDPEQPIDGRVKATTTQPRLRCTRFYYFLALLIFMIFGALGAVVYIHLFHEVGLATDSPTGEASSPPTELPSSFPSARPTEIPSSFPTSRPTTPAPTTRPPTSPPSRRPSSSPSISPSNVPTEAPSLGPTSVETELRALITRITDGNTMRAIAKAGTAQQRAFEWVLGDPEYFEYKERRIVQRFAMAVLYYSTVKTQTSVEALATWLDYDTNECTWFTSWYRNRIACGSDDVFKTLALRNVALTGTIPSELALMTHLNSLVLSDNILTGTLPKEFGRWASLIELDLHANFINGPIPDWTDAPSLQELNLASNRFAGLVPSSIADTNITLLDLAENDVQGQIPPSLCTNEAKSQITVMAVDCKKVACSCCTQCGASQTRAPVLAPFVVPASPPPTARPTVAAMAPSTMGPTPTLIAPTLRPTTTLVAPTVRPTPFATTCNSFQMSKQCYNVGEPIGFSFSNCNPLFADWVGLYSSATSVSRLMDPLLWHRSCGTQSCMVSPSIASFALDGAAKGISSWPLPAGSYRVYLIRNTAGAPYQAAFGSAEIQVSQSGCPNF